MARPPRPPESEPDDAAMQGLVERRIEDLAFLHALRRERIDPAAEPRLKSAIDRFARADARVVIAIARLEGLGTGSDVEDLDVDATIDDAEEAIDAVMATLSAPQAEAVTVAMDAVEVSPDEIWASVDKAFELAAEFGKAPSPRATCACGSGKPYDRCCGRRRKGREPAGPADTRRIHDLDRRLSERMAAFAGREHADAFDRALERYATLTRGNEGDEMYAAYLLYHANVGGRAVVEAWLDRHAGNLDEAEESWLASNRQAVISLWEVIGVVRGESLRLHDLLTDERRTVIERSASMTLEPGFTLCTRVVDHAGLSLLVGLHGRPIPTPEAQEIATELLRTLGGSEGAAAPTLSRDALVGKGSRRVFEAWCDAAAAQAMRSLPRIENTSGEAFEWTTDRFEIADGRRAAVERAIAAIEHVDPADSDEGEPPGSTVYRKAVPGSKAFGPTGVTSHGRIVVTDDQVVVETNSTERADAIRAELEAACGTALRHVKRESKGISELFEDARRLGPDAGAEREGRRAAARDRRPDPHDEGELLRAVGRRAGAGARRTDAPTRGRGPAATGEGRGPRGGDRGDRGAAAAGAAVRHDRDPGRARTSPPARLIERGAGSRPRPPGERPSSPIPYPSCPRSLRSQALAPRRPIPSNARVPRSSPSSPRSTADASPFDAGCRRTAIRRVESWRRPRRRAALGSCWGRSSATLGKPCSRCAW